MSSTLEAELNELLELAEYEVRMSDVVFLTVTVLYRSRSIGERSFMFGPWSYRRGARWARRRIREHQRAIQRLGGLVRP